MTDHTPLPVAGYAAQSQSNVDLANEGKMLEEHYLRWLDKLVAANKAWSNDPLDPDMAPPFDPRFLAEARTCIQTGAMWAIRAIFQPQRCRLPGEP